ncbi:Ankyrin repeats (3 copies) [Legionella santicrucis]|uniref:Ankyrin repeats (3 copies) n=1 Tax=Legionella santicrucis TaxID=45074 RepID=A0A0W0Y9N3_9GAMM|nr:hypothetical protein [Legionella santicrucis]KTD53318.1 Ankyrin repeats (3 copies) [Legionella santicrucis]
MAMSLLKQGIDPNIKNSQQESCLDLLCIKEGWAMEGCYPNERTIDLLKLMIEKGAIVNNQSRYGYTCLIDLCRTGKTPLGLIDFMLKNGFNLNTQDNLGRSALEYALVTFQESNMKLGLFLILKGADIMGINLMSTSLAQTNLRLLLLEMQAMKTNEEKEHVLHFIINEIKENFNFECVPDNKKKEVLTWMLIWNQKKKENRITTPPRPLALSIANQIADIDVGKMLMSLSEEQVGNIISKALDRYQRPTLIRKNI